MQDALDPETDKRTILSPRPRPDLSQIKRRLHEALGCATTNVPYASPECPVHLAPRLSPTTPSMEGRLRPTKLFQLLNHQSYPTTTATSTRYTTIVQKRGKARLSGEKELWMKEMWLKLWTRGRLYGEGRWSKGTETILYTHWLKSLATPAEVEKCNTTALGMSYSIPPLEDEKTASTYGREMGSMEKHWGN